MSRRLSLALAATAVLVLSPSARGAEPPAYRLTMAVPLGAPDRWDYVVFDPASGRVFVAHSDRVTVVDPRSGRILGQVAGTPGGSHGTAVSLATGQGFTDDGEAGQAVAFDLTSLKVLKRIPAAPDADGIVIDPATGRVFVIDGDSGKVTAIDPKSDTVLANIDLGGKLEAAAVGDDARVFVEGAEKREVVTIDTRRLRIVSRFAIPTCVSPHGIAADNVAHRLFVSCVNSQMLVLDSGTGATVATLPIGRGSDSAVWDARRRRAFSSNGVDGTISVIQQVTPDDYRVLTPVTTVVSGRTMALDPVSGRLFVAAAQLEPPVTPGARPKAKPGSLKLMIFEAVK